MNESLSCGKKLQVFGSSICGFEGMYQKYISLIRGVAQLG